MAMIITRPIRERLKALEAEGFTIDSVSTLKNNHVLVWFLHEGERFRITAPSSPSDHRGIKNFVADAVKISNGTYQQQRTK